MPELPEVEHARRLCERVLSGRRLERVWCADDPLVFGPSAGRVAAALRGRRVLGARRRGKYLWLELDRRPWPLIHFGMTGSLRVPDVEPLRLATAPADREDEWPPRFVKLRLWIEGGGELALVDARRLGRVRLREDPQTEPPVRDLGFDPALDLPGPEALAELLRKRRTVLKTLLLDQSFAAGVGNWVADEVLYHARLSPHRRADGLSKAEVARLHRALRRVVETALRADARARDLPAGWLIHRRWSRAPGVTARGEPIRFDTIGGRTTAWVPSVQR